MNEDVGSAAERYLKATNLLKQLSPEDKRLLEELLQKPTFPGFQTWLKKNFPSWVWDWEWQLLVQSELSKITTNENNKLMLFIPPRHGKSEMVTVRYPVYRLQKDPGMRTIIGAYNQILANKFSRKSRRVAEQVGLKINPERRAVEDWETMDGGGFRAIGVGGGITGQGGNLIIVDDPVKSREEAESEIYRDKVYDWFTDDLFTRREPGCGMILIMTRWHEDDLAGRILASEDGPTWTVISLPAEAEEDDPLGRELGAPLCPERFDEKALAELRTVLQLSYFALYQQRPQPKEGSMFKEEWFRQFGDPAPSNAYRVRYWDNAATQDGGDYSVGVLMSLHNGIFTIEDVSRGQWSVETREQMKEDMAARDTTIAGEKLEIWNEHEPGGAGKESAQATLKRLAGYRAYAEHASGDKAIRAEPFAAMAQAGNVRLVRAPWNAAYISELLSFPLGKHDDQVDASAGAFNKLALKVRRPFTTASGGKRTGVAQYGVVVDQYLTSNSKYFDPMKRRG